MRLKCFAVVLLTSFLLLLIFACGKKESAKKDDVGEPLFSVVDRSDEREAESPRPADSSGNSTRSLLDPDAAAREASMRPPSGVFAVNALDDSGFDNQAYAELTAPPDSLAGRLRRNSGDVPLRWRPTWHYSGLGGVKLPVAVLSPDASVLALVELAGTDPDGPYSSLLVLINTYNWQIIRIHELTGWKITDLAFVPNSVRAVLLAERQQSLKKPNKLLLMNLRNGAEVGISSTYRDDIAEILVSADRRLIVLQALADKSRITVSELGNDFSGDKLAGTYPGRAYCMDIAPDGSRLAVAGEAGLHLYLLNNLQVREKLETPGLRHPSRVVYVNDSEHIALIGEQEAALLVKRGTVRELNKSSGRVLAFDSIRNLLLAAKFKENALAQYRLDDCSMVNDFEPGSKKPRTFGTPVFAAFAPHLEKYMVLDSHGNIYLCYIPRQKWRKELLLTPKK